MGREVKRVPLDFEWPIDELWSGFVLPDELHERRCETCDGSGEAPESRWVSRVAYVLAGLADDAVDQERGRPMHPWLTSLDAISYGSSTHRPGAKFAEFVDGLTGVDDGRIFGRDVYRVHRALIQKAGLPDDWGQCPDCHGHGSHEVYPGQRADAEAWGPTDPPSGDGWQLWSTTTEGHPMTPVFESAETLARHCANFGVSWFGDSTATYEQWLKSFGNGMSGVVELAPGVVVM